MLIALLMLAAAGQDAQTRSCVGDENNLTCSTPDGSTYLERRQGEQILRRGQTPGDDSFTEYLIPVFDGWRLTGSDSAGHTWAQSCNPRYGIKGTTRAGTSIFVPPLPRRPATRRPGEESGFESEAGVCR